jgi:succinate dehydrogenase/fumarate reductase flavoprotein subunit
MQDHSGQKWDVIIVGSGAGALSTAVAAAVLGLRVLVLEKTEFVGGTSAWSGGWMWVPRNPLARAAGIDEPINAPRAYLRDIMGGQFDATRVDAFLNAAPAMVSFFQTQSALRFIDGNTIPDFHGRAQSARAGGRSVCAAPFPAHTLGEALTLLRPPRDIWSFLGMSIGSDARHFMRSGRAWDSFFYVAKRILQHGVDVLRKGQGNVRMGGNALAAALLKSALDRGVMFETNAGVERLLTHDGRVSGVAWTDAQGHPHTAHATRAVVLACGGFPHDAARQRAIFPHVAAGGAHFSAAPTTNTGDGLRLGESVGGVVDATVVNAGAWAPVSRVPQADGTFKHFPHLLERGKPGLIAVTADGKRFGNEAGDYHSLMRALFASGHTRAWLIVDHRFQRRYGLGWSKPFPVPTTLYLRRRYISREKTLTALAQKCGIAALALENTVREYNTAAAHGRDPEFHRGETPYERMQGDAEHDGPNPCVAPIVRAPFYAVEIVPGSLGTFAGLKVNAQAQALDAHGVPIAGLYVAGNDMASVMGGHYPSGGITLGPAMTFGFIAAHHIAGVELPINSS